MADVTLVLKADNTQYVRSINEAQKATQKLHDAATQGERREKGILEEIEMTMQRLHKARQKAFTYEDIAKYNKKIEETKQNLKEYEQAGLKVEKQTASLTQTIGKWALSLGGATAVLTILWNKLKQYTDVINAAKLATAAYDQVLYNITTNQANWTQGVWEAIKVQQEFNKLRLREYKDQYDIQKLRTEFQRKWSESLNAELTTKEKIIKIDEALAAHNKAINIAMEDAIIKRDANLKKILLQQGTEENVKAYWDAMREMEQLDEERYNSTKRLTRQKSTLEKEERDEIIKGWHDEIEEQNKAYDERLQQQKRYQDLSKKLIEKYDKSNIESLTGGAKIVAQRNFALKQINDFKNEILAAGALTPEQERMIVIWTENVKKAFADEFAKESPAKVETKNIFSDFVDSLTPDVLRKAKPVQKPMTILELMGIDPNTEQGKKQLDALKEAKDSILSTMDEIFQARVDDAQRRRELLDTQIDETQQELNTEIELYKAGYASNVAAKKKELDDLKKQRDIALKKEEEALKRQRQFDTIMQVSSLISASANIFQAYSKIPGGLLISIGVIAAMFAAFAATKIKAAEMTKLAEGGSGTRTGMITGRSHARGGEHFLRHVEVEGGESWGVLSIPATQRYGKVFHHMVSSFNRGEIPTAVANKISNNVLVENSGPNSRLDAVIAEQRKLNAKLSGDSVQDFGNVVIIRKGSTTRTIVK
jgi:hypothetical protein